MTASPTIERLRREILVSQLMQTPVPALRRRRAGCGRGRDGAVARAALPALEQRRELAFEERLEVAQVAQQDVVGLRRVGVGDRSPGSGRAVRAGRDALDMEGAVEGAVADAVRVAPASGLTDPFEEAHLKEQTSGFADRSPCSRRARRRSRSATGRGRAEKQPAGDAPRHAGAALCFEEQAELLGQAALFVRRHGVSRRVLPKDSERTIQTERRRRNRRRRMLPFEYRPAGRRDLNRSR